LSGVLPVPAVILWEIFPDMGSIRSITITNSFRFSGFRCRTHAIIPIFSVSDGSFGMEKTGQCLRARSRGVSRREAAQLLLEYKAAESYARFLEKKVTTAAVRAKAIFPELGIAVLHGSAWV